MLLSNIWAGVWDRRIDSIAIAAIVGLIAFRFFAGAMLPIYYHDEIYYWLWSRHLAAGYYDHPPAIAFVIRAGTALFGDTAFGARSGGIALVSAATICIGRTASLLAGRREDGVRAALFFNLMLMPTISAIPIFPDAAELPCCAAFMWALAELAVSRNGWWWLVAGVFAGLGLLSKFTMFFFGAGALLWLLVDKDARPWLKTAWPWVGGAVALILFLPDLVWNAQHGWETFDMQFGRIVRGHAKLWYFPAFVGRQIFCASPIILFFALRGFWWECKAHEKSLLPALVVPSIAYFTIHSLHDNVSMNWISFVYPALAVAAADGFRSDRDPKWIRAAAIPIAALILALSYAEGFFRFVPLDPANKRVAAVNQESDAGMRELAAQISRDATVLGAHALVTADYRTTAWLKFYLPTPIPVIAAIEEFRYPDSPRPTAADLSGTLLYVGLLHDLADELADHFSDIDPLAKVAEAKNFPATLFILYRLQGFRGEPIGRLP
jgi:4-amino-4-deoxy-L-arabinose transferase-like glycosyltransferase